MAAGNHLRNALWTAGICGLALVITPDAQAERLAIKAYTTADGLPSTFIQHIVQDSHGFLWFSTRDGLSRFDGYRFVTYSTSHGLPVPTINFLIERRDGTHWIATNGGGVCRFNPSAKSNPPEPRMRRSSGVAASTGSQTEGDALFTCYALGNHLASQRVNQLYEDRAGTLWAGTDSGLFRLEVRDGQWAFQRVPLEVGGLGDRSKDLDAQLNAINPMLEDSEGSLWIGTGWGLVRRLPDGRMIQIQIRPKRGLDNVTSLLEDSAGRLWIGHTEGLFVFKPDSAEAVEPGRRARGVALFEHAEVTSPNHLHDLPVRAGEVRWFADRGFVPPTLYRSRDGTIWCGIAHRLFRLQERTYAVSDIGEWDGAQFGPMGEDVHGNLWMAGRTGAVKLLLNGFTSLGEKDGLAPSHVSSIFEDPRGHVIVVTDRWLLHRFDGFRFRSSRLELPRDMVANWASPIAFVDSAWQWWALTTTGLFRFRSVQRVEQLIGEHPLRRYASEDGLATDSISRLFEDHRGDIWIGTRSESLGGLSRWDRATGRIHRYLESGVSTPKEPSAFAEDRSGNLWVGFYDGGLARVRGDQVLLLADDAGVPPGMVTALHVDGANRLWLATNRSGIARADDPSAARPRFVSYTTSNGLGSDNVRCITEDRQGRIYFGTVRGVDRLDLTTGRVRQYTMADGLANSFVTTAFRDRGGILWFGTEHGVSRLVPRPDMPPAAPPIFISALRVAGVQQPVSELGDVAMSLPRLTADQNRVQFDFHGLGFAMGERLRYQYKLEGVDADWNPVTDERSVTYASLAPGSYRFLVRAINAEAVASPRPASVTFTVLFPLWQRWWVLTMTAALGGLLIAFAYRSRVAHLLALERVRMGIATDLHDDIGSNLSQIAILSEVARHQIGSDGSPAARPLDLIANLSRASVDSMSDIVWATNPAKDWAANLVTRMRNLANEVLAARDIDFAFDVTGEPQARIEAQLRRQVFLVFKESLNNVVRHSGSTHVDITLHLDPHSLVLRVSDQGKGFDTGSSSDGHGLESMRGRAASVGGRLEVVTSPNRGTSLTLTVPRRRVGPSYERPSSPPA
jgi:ligand-binding sensor domain-containing protein/signal transduction histidine kinase